jgi:hypothetical protein
MASNFSLDDAQTLLNKGQYLSIKQPLHFAATHLGVPVSLLEDSIMVQRTQDGGYLPALKLGALDKVGLLVEYKGILEVANHRRPILDVKNLATNTFAYNNRFSARMAMVLHLLINVRLAEGDHWSWKFLEYAKEVVLMVPMTEKKETMVAIGVFYLDGKNHCMLRQIDSLGKILTPHVLSVNGGRNIETYQYMN